MANSVFHALDTFFDIDFVQPLPTVTLVLPNVEPNEIIRVSFIFQHRATPQTPPRELFRNGFYYWIEPSVDSGIIHLGGGGTRAMPNIVQAHQGWTTSSTVGYYRAPNLPTTTQFSVIIEPRDLGRHSNVANLVLTAERAA